MMVTRRDTLAALATATLQPGCAATSSGASNAATLEGRIRGEIVTPEAPDYQSLRRVAISNPRTRANPQVIVKCADDDDVARVIAYARRRDLDLAVRCGGHDMLGASSCDGVLLDLSLMQTIDVDASARVVRVGGGVRGGALSEAVGAHGLAVAQSCDHRPGVSGVTLGGGLGWLLGKHGAACDGLLAAKLVTADGRVVRASHDENPDLLWALKGGGGNFGVVTELTLAAHPIGDVVQGIVAYDASQPADFLRFFRDYAANAGPAVDYELFILPRNGMKAFLKVCYSGDLANAERVLAPLRRYGPPIADTLAQSRYTGSIDPVGDMAALFAPSPSGTPRQPDDAPGVVWSGFSAAPLTDAAIDAMAARLTQADGDRWSFVGGYTLHGAALVDADASAWPRQPGQVTFSFSRSWRRAEHAATAMAWVEGARDALRPHIGPTYINFIGTTDPAVVREAYGANYPRLRRLKRRYDPDNVFRLNRTIEPA